MSRTRGSRTLYAVCLALFVVQLDTTAVNLALPSVGRQVGGGVAALAWVMDAYNLTYAALLMTGGTLGDRYGRRRLFRGGLVLFVAGSIACALSPTFPVLVLGRTVQGVGAALAVPQSMALLAVAYPGLRERSRAMAAWSIVAGVALAAGPLAGGLLTAAFGWRYIFWLNVPVGLAALAVARHGVPESADPTARRPDPAGQLLAVVALGALVYAVVERSWPALPIAVAALVAFLAVERRHPDPMLPLDLVRRGRLPVALYIAGAMTFGMYGMLMLTSIDLQTAHGDSPIAAGLWLLPLPVVYVACSPLVGRLVPRYGPRLPMAAGMATMGLGLLAYAAVASLPERWPLELIYALLGLGLALNTGPVMTVAVSAVPTDRAGMAGALANLARMLGATLGVATLGSLFTTTNLPTALATGALIQLTAATLAHTHQPQRQPQKP